MKISRMKLALIGIPVSLLCLVLIPVFQDWVQAREMRSFRRIMTPASKNLDLPPNAKRIENPEAVDRDIIKEGLEQMTKTWNSSEFADMVSEEFYDKSRLGDAMSETGQYGTTLRVEAMENIQVLDQYVMENSDGTWDRVSKVSAVARTRNEFEDVNAGRVSTPGTNEFIFEIKEKIR